MRTCEQTHPWINFELDLGRLDAPTWSLLHQARAQCAQIAAATLGPATAQELQLVSLVRAVHASAAIEGNPLREDQVRAQLQDQLLLPQTQQHYGQEVANIAAALAELASAQESDGSDGLCVTDILCANEGLLRGLPLDAAITPGQLRAPGQHVRVGRYRGAPPEDLAYLLQRLCEWLNTGFQAANADARLTCGILQGHPRPPLHRLDSSLRRWQWPHRTPAGDTPAAPGRPAADGSVSAEPPLPRHAAGVLPSPGAFQPAGRRPARLPALRPAGPGRRP